MTKEAVLRLLKQGGLLKVIELATLVWAEEKQRKLPEGIWRPTPDEHKQILKTERLLQPLHLQLKEEGLVDIDLDWKYLRLTGSQGARETQG